MKATLLFILLIFIGSKGYCQSENLPDPKPFFIAIIVGDIDRSIDWYSETFGFKMLNKVVNEERGIKQSNLKRGNAFIELIEFDRSLIPTQILSGEERGTRIQGIFKFGFELPDFDSWITFLEGKNLNFYGEVMFDPITEKRMIILKDPDGTRMQLFGDKDSKTFIAK